MTDDDRKRLIEIAKHDRHTYKATEEDLAFVAKVLLQTVTRLGKIEEFMTIHSGYVKD